MTATLTEIARAKINLTLRVIGRRADGYHELESLVAFADVADRLTLQPGGAPRLAVSGPFASASGATADNLVLKAAAALGARVDGLQAGRFELDKTIPVAAGIGGGSADAAAALRLLARANGLAGDDARLMTAALAVGADVPVCLAQRACVMAGVGERLSPPLALPKLPALLVNPGVALATRDVFKAFAELRGGQTASEQIAPHQVPLDRAGLLAWLERQGNDLTEAAIVRAPAVGAVLTALGGLPGVRLARMSGSGSTCFALFDAAAEATAGADRLRSTQAGWWIHAGAIG
jgi:4-diphosphocytidyl-2-C-methyl-D-erythritol kinase